MEAFDTVHARADQVGNHFVGMVESGMSQNSQSAGVVNQRNGVCGGNLELRDPGWLALLEEALEGFVESAAPTTLHQRASDVRPAGGMTTGEREYGLGRQRDLKLVQSCHHLENALPADFLKAGQFAGQLFV